MDFEVEARAKITWGEPPAKVEAFLTAHGCPKPRAQSLVRELFDERKAEIRRRGLIDLVAGGALLGVGLYLFSSDFMPRRSGIISAAAAVLVGMWRLNSGLDRVRRPEGHTGSL